MRLAFAQPSATASAVSALSRSASGSAAVPSDLPLSVAATSGCPFAAAASGPRASPSTVRAHRLGVTSSSKSFEDLPAPKGLPLIGTTLDLIRAGGAARVHEYCDRRHKTLGPIYKEKMGNMECVFIADSGLMQKIYSNEGKYPVHLVPEPWTIYSEQQGIRRGTSGMRTFDSSRFLLLASGN